jgi:hypothetical protein
MADWCGKKMITIKIQKTKILPLRWIGNLFEKISSPHLMKALHYDDHDDHGFAYKYHSVMWTILRRPYKWWGTYYELDLQGMIDDLKGSGWDDYDEFGKAYWDNDKGEQE